MKNLKKLFLMATMAVSSLLLVGVTTVKAEGIFSLEDQKLVCDPSTLEAGGTADCYVIGVPSAQGDVNGFVVKAYTTKYLRLVGSKQILANTGAAWAGQVSSASTGKTFEMIATMPQKLSEFKCDYNTDAIDSGDVNSVEDFGCAAFYTRTDSSVTNAFNKTTMLQHGLTTDKVAAHYGVIGAITVELDEAVKGNDCGKICVQIWKVPVAEEYPNYNNCATRAENPVEGCGADNMQYACAEVHYNETGTLPGDGTETGAFASYALLVAGALVAISAITLAKKNNKFSRI